MDASEHLGVKNPSTTALLIIDVQERFSDAGQLYRGVSKTISVARKIASIAPAFRAANIPIYPVYSCREGELDPTDYYEFHPNDEERRNIIRKYDISAFSVRNIHEFISRVKYDTLLVCGFYLSACVKATVRDALAEGFKVRLLSDLSANSRVWYRHKDSEDAIEEMKAQGVVITTSDREISFRPS